MILPSDRETLILSDISCSSMQADVCKIGAIDSTNLEYLTESSTQFENYLPSVFHEAGMRVCIAWMVDKQSCRSPEAMHLFSKLNIHIFTTEIIKFVTIRIIFFMAHNVLHRFLETDRFGSRRLWTCLV